MAENKRELDPDEKRLKQSYDEMRNKSVRPSEIGPFWQRGLTWRLAIQEKVRELAHKKKKNYKWLRWWVKHETGATTITADEIVRDALEEEPDGHE